MVVDCVIIAITTMVVLDLLNVWNTSSAESNLVLNSIFNFDVLSEHVPFRHVRPGVELIYYSHSSGISFALLLCMQCAALCLKPSLHFRTKAVLLSYVLCQQEDGAREATLRYVSPIVRMATTAPIARFNYIAQQILMQQEPCNIKILMSDCKE
uniref:Uncharacterized protein n=1 Tax=Glossina pallidipes TaxID=7398 RepID=A0A1A9ZT69_GLOPL